MHRWTDPALTPAFLRPCVATFGNFDGVHRGHQAVLASVRAHGQRLQLPTVALTFEPHPVLVMDPARQYHLIASDQQREELLGAQGLAGLCVVKFTRDYAQTTAEDFVRSTFVEGFQARVVVVGHDTRSFGRGGEGDVAMLRDFGTKYGFEVVSLDDQGDSERWSSTAVRRHLADGDVRAAGLVLGRSHVVRGTVVHGAHRGRELGYPTANLGQDSEGLIPADGVYAGWLTCQEGPEQGPSRRLPAAISVGTNPTFDAHLRTVEAYVLDRDDLDLYGQRVAIEFEERIRPMLRFDSVESLLTAMAEDVTRAHAVLER